MVLLVQRERDSDAHNLWSLIHSFRLCIPFAYLASGHWNLWITSISQGMGLRCFR